MDETQVQVLSEPNKTAQSNSYMWVLRSTPPTASAVLFRYEPTRSGDAAKEFLHDFSGALMVDGYEGYNVTCIKNGITRLGCWAHAHRRFIEAQKAQPKGKTGKADQALAHIQQLYRVEQSISDKIPDEKYQARQQQSQPILLSTTMQRKMRFVRLWLAEKIGCLAQVSMARQRVQIYMA